tara:strand:+ start:61 stop:315 length:255 start_codon:yes stop_codon:yes gene_type:complete
VSCVSPATVVVILTEIFQGESIPIPEVIKEGLFLSVPIGVFKRRHLINILFKFLNKKKNQFYKNQEPLKLDFYFLNENVFFSYP